MFEPEMENMKLDDIKKLQNDRLIKMVRYAFENVPFYKRRFKEAGISPDDIRSSEDLHKVPFTVKDDLRDHYPYGILAVPREDIVRFHSSSGTTGIPTVVGYTRKDLDTWSRLMARTIACPGAKKGDIMQNIYGYGLFTGGLGFHYGAELLGVSVIPTSTGNTKRQLKIMKDMKTTVIACTPSYALYLGEAAMDEGYNPKEDFNLKFGLFGAEAWSEEARKKIQDTLGLGAYDCYGLSELYGPGVAMECEHQNGLHIWSDEFLVETINPETGEVLEPGKKGELVFTMLTREAMPLLRYRTKDLATIGYEECECGRSHPRILRVSGRSDDMLIIGGVNMFPSQIEDVLFKIPGLGDQYQIFVDRKILDKMTIKVELSPEAAADKNLDKNTLLKKITDELVAVITIRPKIELLEPKTIPRSVGKAVRVVDLRNDL
ncbi:MAG: phenylacetate--CoA ligase [Thermoplasmata archaeon]|nr:MAG: phenylacetate--CoA ligase [Thermoplasmata archaeon]